MMYHICSVLAYRKTTYRLNKYINISFLVLRIMKTETRSLHLYLLPGELDIIDDAARKERRTRSSFVAHTALQKAREVLKEAENAA